MHNLMLGRIIERARQRQAEGDYPTRSAFTTEQLEDAVVQLADQVEAWEALCRFAMGDESFVPLSDEPPTLAVLSEDGDSLDETECTGATFTEAALQLAPIVAKRGDPEGNVLNAPEIT